MSVVVEAESWEPGFSMRLLLSQNINVTSLVSSIIFSLCLRCGLCCIKNQNPSAVCFSCTFSAWWPNGRVPWHWTLVTELHIKSTHSVLIHAVMQADLCW